MLTRVHSESMLGDVFGSERCDSGSQLDAALEAIAAEGRGVLVYLRGQQGRGLGVAEELRAYTAPDAEACATPAALEDASFPADVRDYGVAAHIVRDLGVGSVRMLTNNVTKVNCMKMHGVGVAEQVPLLPGAGGKGRPHGARSRNGAEPHFV